MSTINIGDKVRSYDFFDRSLEGPNACYIEGVVEAIGSFPNFIDATPRYEIRCTKQVFEGKEIKPEDEYFYPPVNGLERMFHDDKTDFVEKI